MKRILIAICVSVAAGGTAPAAFVPVLTDAQAWKRLPPAEEGHGQPLPAWIRALAGPLPKTAAAMIDLDYAQRVDSPLSPKLRAKLRWVVADANRCEYGRAYARADYVRAGGRAEDLDDLPDRLARLPEAERAALTFVRQLTEKAHTIPDEQVTELIKLFGEKKAVAVVLVTAYGNFQDRLVLALGIPVESGGPLPPVKVRFRKPMPPAKTAGPKTDASGDGKEAPRRKLSPPAKNPPAIPDKLEDPEWTAISFKTLRQRLKDQKASRPGRIAIPDWETVLAGLPADYPRPKQPTRIIWSLVAVGYQPRLSLAWSAGLRAFHGEKDLDPLFHESMFWVVTRSLQCFY
jgi:alkylhydroperoxidase family enzyme